MLLYFVQASSTTSESYLRQHLAGLLGESRDFSMGLGPIPGICQTKRKLEARGPSPSQTGLHDTHALRSDFLRPSLWKGIQGLTRLCVLVDNSVTHCAMAGSQSDTDSHLRAISPLALSTTELCAPVKTEKWMMSPRCESLRCNLVK